MQNIMRMHALQTKSDLVKAVFAEVFREITSFLHNDIRKVPSFHKLKDNPDSILEVKNIDTLDQLIAIEK